MPVNTYDKMFYKGPESALPSQTVDGKILFTIDTGRMFVENGNSRIEISDFIKGMTEQEIKSQLAPLTNKIYISSDTNKFMIYNSSTGNWINIANSGQADHADEATHASTADYATNGGTATYANNSGTVNGKTVAENVPSGAKFTDTTYTGANGISLSGTTFSNSGVRSIATGGTNGTINVNTNGSTANIAVKGLGSLAYKDSLSKSDVGLGNVANLDQSKAIKSITRSGTTFTTTAIDGTTSSFTQQDNNTTYTGTNGISLSGTTFSNSGVRAAATGTTNGTINVNTNGTTSNVAVKGLGAMAYKASVSKSDVGLGNVANYDQSKAIKSITRSGTTFTATAIDGSTTSFTQQDNNTTYTGANGISLSGTTFSNSGVRSIATGGTNGTINVNTNGTTSNVAVKGFDDLYLDTKLNTQDLTTSSRSKNILNMTVENIKKWNTSGTWNGNTYSVGNLTITLLTDDDNNVIGIKSSGTNSGYFNFIIGLATFKPGTYTLTHATDTPSYQDIYSSTFGGGDNWANAYHPATFTVPSEQTNQTILVYRYFNATDNVVYPMIRLASEEDSTFVPYVPGVNSRIDAVESGLTSLGLSVINGKLCQTYSV